MLMWSDEKLRHTIDEMRRHRYDVNEWRNHDNRWRDVMGLDALTDKDIIDFGCGVGTESIELWLAQNRITLADISDDNVRLAARVLSLYGQPAHVLLISDRYPFVHAQKRSFDVFYCNGVLHHIRWPHAIMHRAYDLLRPGGEVRLMVYSDHGWRIATGTEPPKVSEHHSAFTEFVRYFDAVGDYADWYDRARLETRFGRWFEIERLEYLTPTNKYLGAVLRRKENNEDRMDRTR